jgi:integrase
VARREAGAATATIVRELAALRRMFTLAVRAKRIGHAPYIPIPAVSNARQGFLDGEDLERVIGQLPEAVRPVVRFAALTGWRKGEILSLTWAQVDFAAGVVRLEPGTTKNRDGREFPFHALPPLAELLEAQRAYTRAVERDSGRIVPWVFHRGGERIKSLRNGWDAACRRAGLPASIFHDLRRTAVRNLEQAGVPRSTAMKLTGHRTEAIYRRYAIADRATLAEGVAKLARLHAGPAEAATVVPIRTAHG